eukprot:CAMPEP_0167750096 /NCGR_PEP_ID=MMETSP0110_2-20121227/5793_1 /TAXON_ID=629695 /ORGANISM="Gymnochlora sp., Strain CCMP2014" /LENGTH=136 /DNA_ID=CAMNT_0007635363 /DNA_START=476 /DNA_END=886 /DNA_ORIENTATION=-
MATLGAVEWAATGGNAQLYTFGSPRVGNQEFVTWALRNLNTSKVLLRMRRQKDIVPAIPPRFLGYRHIPTEVWNKHIDKDVETDTYVVCDGSGEDPSCGDSEETPFFPLDLLHLSSGEHTKYMGYKAGNCIGGHNN